MTDSLIHISFRPEGYPVKVGCITRYFVVDKHGFGWEKKDGTPIVDVNEGFWEGLNKIEALRVKK